MKEALTMARVIHSADAAFMPLQRNQNIEHFHTPIAIGHIEAD